MAIWATKLSSSAIKDEAKKIGLDWHTIQGVEVHHFDDGTAILVTGETSDARALVDHLVALAMVEAG